MIVDDDRIAACTDYLIYMRPDSVGDEIYWALMTDQYEREEADFVSEYLPPDVDVIEFGAGLGYVSCIIDDTLCDRQKQLAIEPNPHVTPWLRRTKVVNDADYAIRELAYGSEPDTVNLHVRGVFWTATTSRRPGIEVPSTTISELCTTEEISDFSLVMDIEGAEYEVLSEEMDLLEERCAVLVVEFHDHGPYATSFTTELEESAFELVDGLKSVCVYRNSRLV